MRTEWRVGPRWVWLALILLVFSVLVINATAHSTWAQEATSGTAAAGQQGGDTGEGGSYFWWFIKTAGLIGAFIFCLSVYFVATCARLFMELRPETSMPPEILSRCEAMLEQRDFKGIFNVVKEDDSFFSRVLVTGITELPNGLAEAREAMERTGETVDGRNGQEDQHVGRAGHAGADDRAVGHAQGDDRQLLRDRRRGRAVEGRPKWPRVFPKPRC